MSTATGLSPIGGEIKEKATGLVPLLRQRGAEIDTLGRLPDDVVAAMHEAGIWKMIVPVSLGGYAPLKARDIFEIVMEIGRGNSSAAWAAFINLSSALVMGFPEKAVQEFFDPNHVGPYAGASIFNQSHSEGFARKVEGGYMVKGSWSFSSNIRIGLWQVGGAAVQGENGEDLGHIHVMIPRSQIKIGDDWRVTGLKGTGSNSGYTEEEVFVPEHRTLNVSHLMDKVKTGGLRGAVESETLVGKAANKAAAGRAATPPGAGLCAMALGSAYGALEVFMEKSRSRKPWAQVYPTIAEMPSTHIMVAKVRATISMVEAAMERIADNADRIAAGELVQSRAVADAVGGFEPLLAMTMLRDAISDLRNTMGSATAAEGDLLGRFERDVRTMCLHGALRLDWWAETYGRQFYGLPPAGDINMVSEPVVRAPTKHRELIEA